MAVGTGFESVPKPAAWLGLMGLLPFLGLAVLLPWAAPPAHARVVAALLAYGAAILSFLGGIQWGLAIGGGTALWRRLTVSVIPSLLAWIALLLPDETGLLLLALAILATLVVDHRAGQIGEAPPWYPVLRWPLSLAVATLLALAGFLA